MGAFLATPQAIRRRRAFYGAMEPLVGSESALEAINLWENTFGSEQPLLRGIAQYASLVVGELGWSISANDLAIRLIESLQRSEHTLPPDPMTLLTGRSANTGTHSETSLPSDPMTRHTGRPSSAGQQLASGSSLMPGPAAPLVRRPARPLPQSIAMRRSLGVLLLRLCDQAGQADARSQALLVRYFSRLAEVDLPTGVAADVSSLLLGRTTELSLDYGRELAARVINAFYIPLAELFGPVSADRIMTQAVRSAEASAEARDFPPRALL